MTTKATLIKTIASIAKSEANVKVKLAEISRDLLEYICIQGSNDIDTVNRLLNVLTPMNKKTCEMFFTHFLPFNFDKDSGVFTDKMRGERKLDKLTEQADTFLANDGNNIWTWAKDNVKVEAKAVDYLKKIEGDIKKALDPEKGGLDQAEVLIAVMNGGLTPQAIIAVLEAMGNEQQAEAA